MYRIRLILPVYTKIWFVITFLVVIGMLSGCKSRTSPTFTATLTPTDTSTPSPTPTWTTTATPSPTITPTPTATYTPTITPTPTLSPTPNQSPTPTLTPTPEGMLCGSNCRQIKQILRIGNGELVQLAYSPDGKWLAAATSIGAVLYEVSTQKQAWMVEAGLSLAGVAFSSDGSMLIGADAVGYVYHWQVSDGKLLERLKSPNPSSEPPTAVALSPDGSLLAIPGYDDFLYVFNSSDGTQVRKIKTEATFGYMIYKVAFSADNKKVAALCFNGTVQLWQVSSGQLLGSAELPGGVAPARLGFSPDGHTLLVEYEFNGLVSTYLLKVSNASWLISREGGRGAYSPDGTTLALSTDNGISLFALGVKTTLDETSIIEGALAFSPDSDFLAVGTVDGIHIWQVAQGKLAVTLAGEFPVYASLALSPDGRLLALGTYHAVELRSLEAGALVRTLQADGGTGTIGAVAYSPDGQLVAGTADKVVYLWNAGDGALLHTIQADDWIQDLAFSMDSQQLAGAQARGVVRVWDILTGEAVLTLKNQEQSLVPGFDSVAYSPDGQYLAASESLGTTDLWKPDGKFVRSLQEQDMFSWSATLAFSADSQFLAIGDMSRQIVLYNIKTNQKRAELKNISDSVSALVFSPDGQYLASGAGAEIQFWSIRTESALCTIRGHRGDVDEIYFTPDGRLLITQSEDGTVRIWGVE